jgi:hypothetical protein
MPPPPPPPGLAVRYGAVLSVVLKRLDVGRDKAEVVDICWGREEEARGDIVDVGVDGVKHDEATDNDFPAVLCDRTELAEDRVLALTTLEVDPDPVREESVDREATLAKEARVINTFLIVLC